MTIPALRQRGFLATPQYSAVSAATPNPLFRKQVTRLPGQWQFSYPTDRRCFPKIKSFVHDKVCRHLACQLHSPQLMFEAANDRKALTKQYSSLTRTTSLRPQAIKLIAPNRRVFVKVRNGLRISHGLTLSMVRPWRGATTSRLHDQP